MELNGWNLGIMAAAAYVAVMSLVRMMQRRREALVDELGQQIQAEHERRRELKRKENREKFQDRLRDRQRKQAA